MYVYRCKMYQDIELPCKYTYRGSLDTGTEYNRPFSGRREGPWLVIRLADDSVLKCRLCVTSDSFKTWSKGYVQDIPVPTPYGICIMHPATDSYLNL
jgi:hypothetical protein